MEGCARPGGAHEMEQEAGVMRPAGARGVLAVGPVGAPLPAVAASHRLPSLASLGPQMGRLCFLLLQKAA